MLALAFLVENGLESWSALFLEHTLDSSPAVSGLGPGLFAAAMASGRLVAQRTARSSVAGRMVFAGAPLFGGVAETAGLRGGLVFLGAVALLVALSAPGLRRVTGETGA